MRILLDDMNTAQRGSIDMVDTIDSSGSMSCSTTKLHSNELCQKIVVLGTRLDQFSACDAILTSLIT